MDRPRDYHLGSTALSFLLGGVVGATAALLLAPKTGVETRQRLSKGVHDLRDKGMDLASDMEDKAESVGGAIKGAVHDARETYRTELEKHRTAADAKHMDTPEMAGNKTPYSSRA